jgi:hydroxymethylglutaryl-CoA lyase
VAPPEKIREVVSAVLAEYGHLEIGIHLHSRPDEAAAKILAAYDAGCRRFDSAIGGLGGCPFAQDDLVGNIATETVIDALRGRGARLPALKSLDALVRASAEFGYRYKGARLSD